ncbi:putative fructokinase [Synechococcus sp. WH 8109]|uniref:carbohydrate kinase family protein n=1 Tax=Synechococcus sp. WH 8109 TaxID=166314 RepID=UPI0001B8D3D1|nr:carbohydrate kinase [Synechococcus sp. WH 8109]AHF62543.1 putative fructokinase [Synechococcus sp. WH 8109]
MALGSVVACLGEALIDRLGPPGGDPAVDRPVDDRLGGAPANVACGLARLGTPVVFVGRLGQDAIGEAFTRLFAERGVGTTLLQRDAERPSRIVLVRRSMEGERQFQGFAGDQGAGFADQALESFVLPEAQWLLIGTLLLAAPTSASALLSAVRQARNQGMAIALDVNWRPTFWDATADPEAGPSAAAKAAIQPLLRQAALIKLATEEALWFFNSDDPAAIQRALPQRPDVVVTNGAAPVRWQLGADSGQQAAFQLPSVVDTTGAGDAFTAGLLHRWAAASQERIRFAAACGAMVCGGAGGIDPQPTQAQVEAFLGGVS